MGVKLSKVLTQHKETLLKPLDSRAAFYFGQQRRKLWFLELHHNYNICNNRDAI